MSKREPPAHHHTGRIKDARGRNVTQLDPITMRLLRQHDAIPVETLRNLAEEIGVGWSRIIRALFFMTMVSLLLGIIVGVEFFLNTVVRSSDFVGFFRKMAPLTPIWVGPLAQLRDPAAKPRVPQKIDCCIWRAGAVSFSVCGGILARTSRRLRP